MVRDPSIVSPSLAAAGRQATACQRRPKPSADLSTCPASLGKTSHARQAFVISWVSVTLSVVAAAVGIWLSIVEGSLVDAESVSLFDAPLGHAQ